MITDVMTTNVYKLKWTRWYYETGRIGLCTMAKSSLNFVFWPLFLVSMHTFPLIKCKSYIFCSPDFDSAVLWATVQKTSTTPLHTGHSFRMTCQRQEGLSKHYIPYSDVTIFRSTRHSSTFWVARNRNIIWMHTTWVSVLYVLKCFRFIKLTDHTHALILSYTKICSFH
jgi:hypothetical protein